MKSNNFLLLIDHTSILDKLKEESNITFLFPLKKYSVGFENTFDIKEIPTKNAFIFINRILDNESLDDLKTILKNLPANIKGIVFDDIGILNVLIDENINIEKILFLNHLNCNYESINAWLEYVNSVIPSTDITKEELEEILKESHKPLTVFTFGHINIMYSRRTLISNYNKNFGLNAPIYSTLEEKMGHQKFKIIENEYGTVIYTDKPYNGLYLKKHDHILYNFINTVFLSDEEILKIIKSDDGLTDIYPYRYLSTEKTIFKLKEEEK